MKTGNKIYQNSKFGLVKAIKQAYKIPEFLRILPSLQHGWYPNPEDYFMYYLNDKNRQYYLTWNKENYNRAIVKSWKKAAVGCPYVSYRKLYKLHKSSYAVGTIFYPQHGTEKDFVDINYLSIIKELQSLPSSHQPVTVSLFYTDYLDDEIRGRYEKYFSVRTAGDPFSENYMSNFYSTLHKHKYAIGNDVTTASLLAIESGIPFFLTKNTDFNYKGKKTKKVLLSSDQVKEIEKMKIFYDLFGNEPIKNIDNRLIKIVNDELGIGQQSHILKIYLVILFSYLDKILNKKR